MSKKDNPTKEKSKILNTIVFKVMLLMGVPLIPKPIFRNLSFKSHVWLVFPSILSSTVVVDLYYLGDVDRAN